MKKIFKKNQIIVTMLAVLIAVAGYLKYSENSEPVKQVNSSYDSVYSDDDLVSGNSDIESMDEDLEETRTGTPGEAILTNGMSMSSYMTQARLNREQTRSKNKETLLEVINNQAVTDKEKKKAVKSMVKISDRSELENTMETLLKAKGFSDIVITISDEQADVIVSSQELDESKRAQIEDVIKRKTGFGADMITITPANEG